MSWRKPSAPGEAVGDDVAGGAEQVDAQRWQQEPAPQLGWHPDAAERIVDVRLLHVQGGRLEVFRGWPMLLEWADECHGDFELALTILMSNIKRCRPLLFFTKKAGPVNGSVAFPKLASAVNAPKVRALPLSTHGGQRPCAAVSARPIRGPQFAVGWPEKRTAAAISLWLGNTTLIDPPPSTATHAPRNNIQRKGHLGDKLEQLKFLRCLVPWRPNHHKESNGCHSCRTTAPACFRGWRLALRDEVARAPSVRVHFPLAASRTA